MTPKVTIVEVGPRDGLQNIPVHLPVETKLEIIKRLHQTGLSTIELTSVVSPKAVPQLRDYSQVLNSRAIQALLHNDTGRYPVLVPNLKGLEMAQKHGVKDIAVFISATEGFSKANTNRSVAQGISISSQVAKTAMRSGISVRGQVMTNRQNCGR
jgi:hydroxymethylglutaryl-CoA lyase